MEVVATEEVATEEVAVMVDQRTQLLVRTSKYMVILQFVLHTYDFMILIMYK